MAQVVFIIIKKQFNLPDKYKEIKVLIKPFIKDIKDAMVIDE
jgi:hypothetical protein